MPGTIQVLVLGFIGHESSSTTPSQICIKVSMGKKEYQTRDAGEFSFPLATFRDKLIIALEDAEGNEISHTDVETRLVVEKGTWVDHFPIGNGLVHLKLQFVLSEKDRQRVRLTRQQALKKKHNELQSSEGHKMRRSFSNPEASISLSLSHEVSDSQNRPLHSAEEQPGLASKPPNLTKNGKSASNDTDACKHTSPTPGHDIDLTEANWIISAEKVHFPVEPIDTEESSISLRSLVPVIVSKPNLSRPEEKDDEAKKLEKLTPSKKAASSVRNMISAFESGLSRDKGPRMRGSPTKLQSNMIGKFVNKGDPRSFPRDNDADTPFNRQLYESTGANLMKGSMALQNETNVEEDSSSKDTVRDSVCKVTSVSSSATQIQGEETRDILNKELLDEKENSVDNMRRKLEGEDASASSTSEARGLTINSKNEYTAINKGGDSEDTFLNAKHAMSRTSGKTLDEHKKDKLNKSSVDADSREENGREDCVEGREFDIQRSFDEKVKSSGDYSSERSNDWIFLDEMKDLREKQTPDLTEDCCQEANTSSSPSDHMDENEYEDYNINTGKSTSERSTKAFEWRIEQTQMFKVAITLGFAALVILTRHRK